jgi:hypothetical protein
MEAAADFLTSGGSRYGLFGTIPCATRIPTTRRAGWK